MFKDRYYKIGYRYINNGYLFENKKYLKEFVFLKNPFGRWNADPFPITIEGKHYIFAESASIISRKGEIWYLCLDDEKKRWKRILKRKKHLSFPNIFYENQCIYLIPESNQENSINLYKVDFLSKKIKIEKTIYNDCAASDTVFIKNTNFNYMFTYIEDRLTLESYFCLLNTNKNSICFSLKDEERKLRPAGNLFYFNDSLIFPTQDNHEVYGGNLLFNYFQFDECGFTKKTFLSIGPNDLKEFCGNKEYVGIHTYNFNEDVEVIDTIELKKSFCGFIHVLLKKILRK